MSFHSVHLLFVVDFQMDNELTSEKKHGNWSEEPLEEKIPIGNQSFEGHCRYYLRLGQGCLQVERFGCGMSWDAHVSFWDEVDIQLKSHTTILCCWHVQRHVALHNMSSIYSRDAAPIGRWIWAIVESKEFGAIDFAHWFFPLRGGGGAVGGMLGAFKRDTLIDLEFSSKYTTKPMKAPKIFPSFLAKVIGSGTNKSST